MNELPDSRKREVIATAAVLLIIAVLVVAITVSSKKTSSDSSVSSTVSKNTTTSSKPPSSNSDATATSSSTYKDGSYSATGNYDSPGGNESITISVTLQNGDITATSAKSGANDDEAQEFQGMFISGYKQLVVGKPIASVSLSRVSGSSLTSQGFNDAIGQIKQEAQS